MSCTGFTSKGSPKNLHQQYRPGGVRLSHASSILKSDHQSNTNALPESHATVPKNAHLSKFVSATLRSIQHQALSTGRAPETDRSMLYRCSSPESVGSHGVASAEASAFECGTAVDSMEPAGGAQRNSVGGIGTPFVLRSFSRFLPFYQLAIKEIIAECERKVANNNSNGGTGAAGAGLSNGHQQNHLPAHTMGDGSVEGSVSPSVSTKMFDGPPPEYAFFDEMDEDGDIESVAPSSSFLHGSVRLDGQAAARLEAGSILSVDSCTPAGTTLWPKESLELFLTELGKLVSCKETAPLVFTAALVFLSRIARRAITDQEGVTAQNWFRLTTVSILVAFKMFSEGPGLSRANRYFASSSNIPLEELNRLEIDFLYLIDFDLFLEERDVMCWVMWMERLAHQAGMVTPLQTFMLMAPPSRAASTIGYSASTLPDVGEGGQAAYYSYSHSGIGVIRSPTSFFSAHHPAGGTTESGMGFPTSMSSAVCGGGGNEFESHPRQMSGVDFWDENQRHQDGLTRSSMTFHNSGANFLDRQAVLASPVNEVTAGATQGRLFSAIHLAADMDGPSPSLSSLKHMSLQGATPYSPPLPPTSSPPPCLGPLQKKQRRAAPMTMEDSVEEDPQGKVAARPPPPPLAAAPAPSMLIPSFLEGRPRGRRNKQAKTNDGPSSTACTRLAAPVPFSNHEESRRINRAEPARASRLSGRTAFMDARNANSGTLEQSPTAPRRDRDGGRHHGLEGVAAPVKKTASGASTAPGDRLTAGAAATSATGPIRKLVGRFREVVKFTSALARGRLDVLSPQGVRRSSDGDVRLEEEEDDDDEEDVRMSGSLDMAPGTPQEVHHHRHHRTPHSATTSATGSGVHTTYEEEDFSPSSSMEKGSGSFRRPPGSGHDDDDGGRPSGSGRSDGDLGSATLSPSSEGRTPLDVESSVGLEPPKGHTTRNNPLVFDGEADAPAAVFRTSGHRTGEGVAAEIDNRPLRHRIPVHDVKDDDEDHPLSIKGRERLYSSQGSQQESTYPFFETHSHSQHQKAESEEELNLLPPSVHHEDPQSFSARQGGAGRMVYHVHKEPPYTVPSDGDYSPQDYYDDEDDDDNLPPYMRAPPRTHSPPCMD